MQSQTKPQYILYARKSSESEDRQIQSIDDQVNRLKELAGNLNLKVKKIYTEAKSAKMPGIRPVFEQMMKDIEEGKVKGILAWQINRLSRNPIDSASIQWFLQQGKIESIQTIDKEYRPEDNALLFSVESGVANQFLIDLSKNVKRGNQCKLKKGWKPGMAPCGYKNDKEEHTIIVDSERFPLIRKAWNLLLTGNYTVPKILDKLNNDWGFLSIKRRRSGGKPLSSSGLYRIFTDTFYAGIINYKDEQYPGKHETMITLDEYDKAQIILGREGKPRPQKHIFAYTGLIRCKECGCYFTAEKKIKRQKNGNIHHYTYYRCTKKHKHVKCSQPYVRDEKIDEQIAAILENHAIPSEFSGWLFKYINKLNDTEIDSRTAIYKSQQTALNETEKQLDNLTKMRYRELITDEEYIKEKKDLKKRITHLRTKVKEIEQRADNWREATEKAFNFAIRARYTFETKKPEGKKEILASLGSNLYIFNKKLVINIEEWLKPIKKASKRLKEKVRRLELLKGPDNKGQMTFDKETITLLQG